MLKNKLCFTCDKCGIEVEFSAAVGESIPIVPPKSWFLMSATIADSEAHLDRRPDKLSKAPNELAHVCSAGCGRALLADFANTAFGPLEKES